jgi:hypothetical protein
MSQQTNVLAAALGLMIKKFGSKCETGYEIFIPQEVLVGISPDGQIQHQIDPEGKGIYLRYYPNNTIEGTLTDGGRIQLAQADDKEPA